MESRFAAPMSRDVKAVSWSSPFIFGGTAVLPFAARYPWPSALCVLWAVLWTAVLVTFSLFRIRAYLVTEEAVVVQMVARRKTIPLEGLVSVSADPQAMAHSTRWFGNGGLFAATGLFHNAKLGDYRAYASDPGRAVVLSFPDRRIVVTPDRPEGFAALLTQRINAGA